MEPLIVVDRVERFLDDHGLGGGPLTASRIGDGGGSNFTFLLERGDDRFVLRRPPRPPLPPSAHDMVREAGLQLAVREGGFGRLPEIVAVCDDDSILGVPFYVMRFLDGYVVTQALPAVETADARRRLANDLVDTLVEIHAADVSVPALAAFARPGSYAERQVRRFTQLWELNRTRPIPDVDEVGRLLARDLPQPLRATVVHGDFRLGNMMVSREEPTRVEAVLDWEMGAIGDPRADVGYLLATYSEPGGRQSALGSSPVTASEGFPSRDELVERYARTSGRARPARVVRSARALEGGRLLRGDLRALRARGNGAEDTRAALFERGVPRPGSGSTRGGWRVTAGVRPGSDPRHAPNRYDFVNERARVVRRIWLRRPPRRGRRHVGSSQLATGGTRGPRGRGQTRV